MAERMSLSTKILLGLLVGVGIGLPLNQLAGVPGVDWFADNILYPIGQIFLRSLFMIVVPLVLSSLALGVTTLGSAKALGRIGSRTFGFFVATTIVTVILGAILATIFVPGAGLDSSTVESIKTTYAKQVSDIVSRSFGAKEDLWPELLIYMVPKNMVQALVDFNMLSIILIGLLLGGTIVAMGESKGKTLQNFLESVAEASSIVVSWIMRFAPYAVAALIALTLMKFGLPLLYVLLKYILVVLFGFLLIMFIVYPIILRFVIHYPVGTFYKKILPVILTAFSTSSSNATLPTTIVRTEKHLGVSNRVASFTLPLGATINMDGTGLFGTIVVLFAAQVMGVDLSFGSMIVLAFMMLIIAISAAGIPSGAIPLLAGIMISFGIPGEGIALVIAVDRLLDMARTVVNVTGDVVTAMFVADREGEELQQ